VVDVSITDVLEHVDEVHVMTSLTGFEALMLGKRVVTYGNPFYAGWGLTVDRSLTRTGRQPGLTLEALIAATLICYPTYVSTSTGRFTTAERVLEELDNMRARSRASTERSLLLQGAVKARQFWTRLQRGPK
jgi:capsular polysaccharide export protein